jgi:hypothetical protein
VSVRLAEGAPDGEPVTIAVTLSSEAIEGVSEAGFSHAERTKTPMSSKTYLYTQLPGIRKQKIKLYKG